MPSVFIVFSLRMGVEETVKIRTGLGGIIDLNKLHELTADNESGIEKGLLEALDAVLRVPPKRYGDEHNDDAYAIAYNVALKDIHRAAGLIIEENDNAR